MAWSMGIRPPGWDPTWTPDQLENALTDAGDKLYNFLLSRSSLVKKYLTYVDKGPQQGWVGREYENWARQFNDSQFVMGKYVNQLYGRAVDAHNAAVTAQYEQEMRDLNKEPSWVRWKGDDQYFREHRPRYRYIEPVRWDKAPVNTDPYNAEGANPECLSQYSCKTTQGNENIRAFFSTTLASAAAALPEEDNAPSSGGNPPASTLARAITYFLRYQVLELDARVGMIGKAFQEAGNQVPGTNFRTTTQQQLDQKIGDDEAPFARTLAQYASQHGIDNYVLQQLMIHQNDPYYTSVFFNALNKSQFQDLLTHITQDDNPADQQTLVGALVSAYANPDFNKNYQRMIANWLINTTDSRQVDVESNFLMQIQGNPTAAYNFIESLPPEQFTSFANGSNAAFGAQPDSTAQGIAGLQDKYSAMFLQDCAAAMAAPMDSAHALQLMDRIYNAYSEISPTDPTEIPVMAAALSTLLSNFYTAYFQAPPIFPKTDNLNVGDVAGAALEKFINNEINGDAQTGGKGAAYYAWGFSQWIYNADQAIGNDQVSARQLAEGVVASAALAAIPGVDVVAVTISVAAVEEAATSWALPQLDSMILPDPPDAQGPELDFYKQQACYAMVRVATQLLAQGQLRFIDSSGNPETISQALNNAHVSKDGALHWLLENGSQVQIVGTNETLSTLTGQVGMDYLKAAK